MSIFPRNVTVYPDCSRTEAYRKARESVRRARVELADAWALGPRHRYGAAQCRLRAVCALGEAAGWRAIGRAMTRKQKPG